VAAATTAAPVLRPSNANAASRPRSMIIASCAIHSTASERAHPPTTTRRRCDMADAPADMAGGSSSSPSFRCATWTRRPNRSEDAIDLTSSGEDSGEDTGEDREVELIHRKGKGKGKAQPQLAKDPFEGKGSFDILASASSTSRTSRPSKRSASPSTTTQTPLAASTCVREGGNCSRAAGRTNRSCFGSISGHNHPHDPSQLRDPFQGPFRSSRPGALLETRWSWCPN
jgi:hypothetical protein